MYDSCVIDRLKDWRFLSIALIVLASILVYAQAIGFEFLLFDDELLIIDNPKIRGLSWAYLKQIFTTYDPELYIPLTLLTHQIEYSLSGINPVIYHTTNVVLHTCNAVLVFLVFTHLINKKTALIVALLFAVHPLNAEAVAWASARKDVLSSFFFLFSLHWYLTAKKKLSVFAFLCGLLSKVSIAPLPFVLLVIDWFKDRPPDRSNIKEKLPYFILAAVFVVIALLGKSAQAAEPLIPVLLAFVSIPFYLLKLIVPTGLSIFYPFTDVVSITHPRVLIGAAILVLITVATWKCRIRKKAPFAAWLFFLLMVAPSLTNVVKGGDTGSYDLYFASDRYVYLAGLGLLLLIGTWIKESKWVYWIPLVVLFGFLGYSQVGTWRNSELLFRNATETQSNSHIAYNNLGGIMVQNKRYSEAIDLYEKSIGVKENPRALFNLGKLYAVNGRLDEAIALYERVLPYRPDDAEVYAQMGGWQLMKGRVNSALSALQKANELNPNVASVHYNLGLIYEHKGQQTEALREYKRVLELDPSDTQAQKKVGLL